MRNLILLVFFITFSLSIVYSEETNIISNSVIGESNIKKDDNSYSFRVTLDTGYLIDGLFNSGFGIGADIAYFINNNFALKLNYGFETPNILVNEILLPSSVSLLTGGLKYYFFGDNPLIYLSVGLSYLSISFNYGSIPYSVSELLVPIELGWVVPIISDSIVIDPYFDYYIYVSKLSSPGSISFNNQKQTLLGLRIGVKL